MAKVITMEDFQDAMKISDMAHASNEPIFVTKNGSIDLVVLDFNEYESLIHRNKIHDALIVGVNLADNGQLLDSDEVLASLKTKHCKFL